MRPRPLSRREASEYLFERHGIKHTPATLAKLACIGGGPAYRKVHNKIVIYDPADLDDYAERSTSKHAATSAAHAAAAA
jgi:hypothetical protein